MEDKRPALELLLSAEPLLSPPVELEVRGRKVRLVFRELSQNLKERLRFQAIAWVEDQRKRSEEAAGCDWRDVGMDLMELRADRWDLLLLHAAMRDAETLEEACSLKWLEDRLGSETHKFLAAKYHEFEQGLNPDQVTQESILAFVEELKKKDHNLVSLWTQYGSLTVYASALYMASLLPTSQTESSSDTSSCEE